MWGVEFVGVASPHEGSGGGEVPGWANGGCRGSQTTAKQQAHKRGHRGGGGKGAAALEGVTQTHFTSSNKNIIYIKKNKNESHNLQL